MLIKSEALDKSLTERTDRSKLRKFLRMKQKDIRAILLENGKNIGYLRYCSSQNKWMLKFGDLDFYKFTSKKTLEINKRKLVLTVISNSKNCNISSNCIEKEMDSFRDSQFDLWIICNGHDLINILLIGFKEIFGKYVENFTHHDLERSLRLSYEFDYLKNTEMYNKIVEWQEKNKPYIIFRNT